MKRKRTAQSAPARRSLDEGGFFNLRASIAVFLCALVGCSVLSATLLGFFSPQAPLRVSERTLSFAERVTYQRAIEDVYWRHRIWPKERANPKPPLDSVMPRTQVEKKVADYLRKSQALEDHWQRPITAEQLQAEMDRIAANTKQPDVLRELFEALGGRPFCYRGMSGETNRRGKHTQRDYDSGNRFRFPVTVRVRLVWRPRSDGQASPNDNRAAYIECGLDAVGN